MEPQYAVLFLDWKKSGKRVGGCLQEKLTYSHSFLSDSLSADFFPRSLVIIPNSSYFFIRHSLLLALSEYHYNGLI